MPQNKPIMKAISITGKSPEAIRSELHLVKADGMEPTLAIVFMPVALDHSGICRVLDEAGIAIFGANTPAEFTDAGMAEKEAAILLLDLSPDHFRIVFEHVTSPSPETTVEKAKHIARVGLEAFSRPAYILTGSSFTDTRAEALVQGFTSVAGEDVTLIGGMAGGAPILENGLVFTNQQESSVGLICLILDQGKVEVQGMAVSGWKPVGTPKTITKSEGNWVYTIDDQPAMDMVLKFTGQSVDLSDSKDIFYQIGENYPFQMIPAKGAPVMNPPLMFNLENKAVMCGFDIPQGSKIHFSLPPDFDIVDTVVRSARNIKERSLPEADAMLIFSCIGRLDNLGPMSEEENKGLQQVWCAPMIGFFSFGEFGTAKGGKPTYHGTTCSWVTLKEKNGSTNES